MMMKNDGAKCHANDGKDDAYHLHEDGHNEEDDEKDADEDCAGENEDEEEYERVDQDDHQM